MRLGRFVGIMVCGDARLTGLLELRSVLRNHLDSIGEDHLVELLGVVWDAAAFAGFSEGGKGVEVH